MASNSAVSSGENSISGLRRLDTAALTAASGVRRSWLTAESSARRSLSASARAEACDASSARRAERTRPTAVPATTCNTRASLDGTGGPLSANAYAPSSTRNTESASDSRVGGSSPTLATAGPSAHSRLTAVWL
ncbi:Uncharacterised protein [Mycobacteroides abscessus subsp. abscessus]|nr:Uncharacterised protein [Mycobacteroides abscessus subsp. abscessus]